MKKLIRISVILMSFLLGFAAAYLMLATSMKNNDNVSSSTKKENKILYWVAPMDPNYRRDKPGKSPMGMDLVPVYAKGQGNNKAPKNAIKISPQVIDNLGVVSERVGTKNLSQSIDTVGFVQADEDNIESIHLYADGWVSDLKVNAIGDVVVKGQVLFRLYSPKLVAAEEEYLLALKNQSLALIKAGEKKLLTLGLTKSQIKQLQIDKRIQKNIPIYAKKGGVLSALNIRDGMYVTSNTKVMVIEDLRSIWVKVFVYEKDASLLKKGQMATASFSGLPGEKWQGEVIYVYPRLDKKTHTLKARLIFKNPKMKLKPNMVASVTIKVPFSKPTLAIPQTSVIYLENGPHVILALDKGYFKPVPVKLGISGNGYIALRCGLKKGDRVVTYGQFLIDSESSLNGAFTRLAKVTKKPKPKMRHHHHHKSMKKD